MLTFKLQESIPLMLTHYQWQNVIKPQTSALLRLTEEGLCVHFEVQESNPHITVLRQLPDMPKVCFDSAVEIFLSFPDELQTDSFEPFLEKNFYTNIEINAAGVCQAKYGHSRKNRKPFTLEQINSMRINAVKHAEFWTVDLIIPRSLIIDLIGYDGFAPNSKFAFNLYKISETKEFEHYVAFHKLDSETPNFHLPQCFARAHVAP